MDTFVRSIEFLDLSDTSEQERSYIVSTLHSTPPLVNLPWEDKSSTTKGIPGNVKDVQETQIRNVPNATVTNLSQEYNQQFPKVLSTTHPDNPNLIIARTPNQIGAKQNTNGFIGQETDPIDDNIKENVKADELNNTSWGSNKTFASLFNKSCEDSPIKSANVSAIETNANGTDKSLTPKPFNPRYDDPVLYKLGAYLTNYPINHHVISLQPRGLVNRSNYCYINSILQAVLACPPMYNLLNDLSCQATFNGQNRKVIPGIESMIKLVQQFRYLPASFLSMRRANKKQPKENATVIDCDLPFEPFWIYKMLSAMKHNSFVIEGRQEDAEEFLGCLLNSLNDEMLELMKSHNGCTDQQEAEKTDDVTDWPVMGPKNKGSITRHIQFNRTPISDIFGGLLRLRIHRSGGDQPTDNIQPFYTLQLNIEKAHSVKEALDVLVAKNQLEGVTSSRTNKEVEAWQQVTLEELPTVLVLHLKCFDYKLDGCSKIMKALEYSVDLKIDAKLLSFKANYTSKEKQYKLFAVVYHEGKEATKGHYFTDAYHIGYASWLRYDDTSVKMVQEEDVLKPQRTRVPYLLFYRRCDSMRSKQVF